MTDNEQLIRAQQDRQLKIDGLRKVANLSADIAYLLLNSDMPVDTYDVMLEMLNTHDALNGLRRTYYQYNGRDAITIRPGYVWDENGVDVELFPIQ